MAPENLIQDVPRSDAASPHIGALNGKATSPDAPNTDADGNVNMAQPTHVNSHADTVDIQLNDPFAAHRSRSRLGSPHLADVDGPPPAKWARKLSDADLASIANTASPPPATGSSIQMNEEATASPIPTPPTPVGAATLSVAQHQFYLSTVHLLRKMKDATPFLHPINPVALNIPHYPTIIENPMDLGLIEYKLMSSNPQKPDPNPNNPRYNNMDEFIVDIRLIFTNCLTFNRPDHAISNMGKHVKSVFDKQIKNLPPPGPQVVKPPVKIATPPSPPSDTKKVSVLPAPA